jgi:integrase
VESRNDVQLRHRLHLPLDQAGWKTAANGGILVTDYIHPAAVAADILELRDGVRYYDGKPVLRFGLHSMRHGLATWLADRGVHPSVIQRMLRRSSPNMTMHYIHSDARKAQEEFVEELPSAKSFIEKGALREHNL